MRKKIKQMLDNPKTRRAILLGAEFISVILLGLYIGYGLACAAIVLDSIVRRLN